MIDLVHLYNIDGFHIPQNQMDGHDSSLPPVEKGFFNLKPALKHVRFATPEEIHKCGPSILAALKSVRNG